MQLALVDFWALKGKSVLHLSSTKGKLIFAFASVLAIILTHSLDSLFYIIALLTILSLSLRLPLRMFIHFLIYPVVFSGLFSLVITGVHPLLIIGKALASVLVWLILITTTPYVKILAELSPVIPKILLDGIYMTYRSFFLLIDQFSKFFLTLKFKGAYSPRRLWRNLSGISSALGIMLIHSIEQAERLYTILELRGYQGGFRLQREGMNAWDILPVATGLIIIALVVV